MAKDMQFVRYVYWDYERQKALINLLLTVLNIFTRRELILSVLTIQRSANMEA